MYIYLIKNILQYWMCSFIIFIVMFLPGWLIVCRTNLSDIEKLSISFGASVVILILFLLLFISNYILSIIIIIFFIILMLVLLVFEKEYCIYKIIHRTELKLILLIFAIAITVRLYVQTFWEYPVIGGDWYYHALVIPYKIENLELIPPRDRTPLFSLIIFVYHKLLCISLYEFWVSQIISVFLNSLFLFPAYMIARKVFGIKIALMATIFMTITPFLLEQSIYTWPKNLAMYFILLMIYFAFFSKIKNEFRYILAGIFGGLGFLAHNYTTVYIITALFALIYYYKIEYKSQFRKKLMKSIYLFILGIILPLIPYFCWVFISYGTIFTSHFMYYPFAVDPEDVDTILHGDPDMVVKKFFSTPISKILWVKVIDIVVTLTPATLPINPIATSFRTYFPVYYYSHDYPGALSTLMYILIVIWFIRYILRKSKTDKILFIFVAVPFILFLVVSGWLDWGMLTAGLHPTIPILIMLGFNELEKVTQDKLKYLLKIFVFVGAIIENTIFMWLLLAFYKLEGGITQVEEGIRRYIPNFNVSKFVSAHFFTGNFEAMSIVLNTFIFLALIIILLIFLFRINKTLFTEYSPKNWEF